MPATPHYRPLGYQKLLVQPRSDALATTSAGGPSGTNVASTTSVPSDSAAADTATSGGARHGSIYGSQAGSHIKKMLAASFDQIKTAAATPGADWSLETNLKLDISHILAALSSEEPQARALIALQCRQLVQEMIEQNPQILAHRVRPYLEALLPVSELPERRDQADQPKQSQAIYKAPAASNRPHRPYFVSTTLKGPRPLLMQVPRYEKAMEKELLRYAGIGGNELEAGHAELRSRIRQAAQLLVKICMSLDNELGFQFRSKPEDMAKEVVKTLKRLFTHDRRLRALAGALDGGLVYTGVILLFSELIIPKSATLAKVSPAMLGFVVSLAITVPMELLSRLLSKLRDNHLLAESSRSDDEAINRLFPENSLGKTVATYALLMGGLTGVKNMSRMLLPLFLAQPMNRTLVGRVDTALDTVGSFIVGAVGVLLAHVFLHQKSDKPMFLARSLEDLESTMRHAMDEKTRPPVRQWLANDAKTGAIEMLKTFVSMAVLLNVGYLGGMISLLFHTKALITANLADPTLADTDISPKETVLRALDSVLLMTLLVGGAVSIGIGVSATVDASINKKLGKWIGDFQGLITGSADQAQEQAAPHELTSTPG